MSLIKELAWVKLKDAEVTKVIDLNRLFPLISNYFFPAQSVIVTPEVCDFMSDHYPLTGRKRGSKVEIIAGIRQFQMLSLNQTMRETAIPVLLVARRLSNAEVYQIAFRDLVLSQTIFSARKPFDLMSLLVEGLHDDKVSLDAIINGLNRTEIATFFDIKVQTLKHHVDKKFGVGH